MMVLQGRTGVRDALVDFAQPDRSFGAAARDNAVAAPTSATRFWYASTWQS